MINRQWLRARFKASLRQFDATSHLIGNHIIEFETAERAQAVVYCQARPEMGQNWMVAQSVHHDRYEKHAGRWFFGEMRAILLWYASDMTQPPIGPDKVRRPGRPAQAGTMHALSPAWEEFRAQSGEPDRPMRPMTARKRFLVSIRRSTALPESQAPRDFATRAKPA